MGSEVSAHYVVLQDGYIIQLVPETRRAWHAAVSSWAGDIDLNSRSIGIEIANPGHEHGYPDFPRRQIAAVTTLCRSILTRHDVRLPTACWLILTSLPRAMLIPAKNFFGNCWRIPASGSGSNLSLRPKGPQFMCRAKPIPQSY
jgi:hypothetical protein